MDAETQRTIQLISKASADAFIIQAEVKAQAIMKEGDAKAATADTGMMQSKFGRDLAMLRQKVKIAEGLEIHTLVMGGEGQEIP